MTLSRRSFLRASAGLAGVPAVLPWLPEAAVAAEVKAFAETMLRDHEAVNDKALALVKKLNVTPADNATSQALAKQAKEMEAKLAALGGVAFDRAYAANEVGYHRTVNGALKDTLIPSANNAELKGLLKTGLTLFSEHQAHAEHLAASLK